MLLSIFRCFSIIRNISAERKLASQEETENVYPSQFPSFFSGFFSVFPMFPKAKKCFLVTCYACFLSEPGYESARS